MKQVYHRNPGLQQVKDRLDDLRKKTCEDLDTANTQVLMLHYTLYRPTVGGLIDSELHSFKSILHLAHIQ